MQPEASGHSRATAWQAHGGNRSRVVVDSSPLRCDIRGAIDRRCCWRRRQRPRCCHPARRPRGSALPPKSSGRRAAPSCWGSPVAGPVRPRRPAGAVACAAAAGRQGEGRGAVSRAGGETASQAAVAARRQLPLLLAAGGGRLTSLPALSWLLANVTHPGRALRRCHSEAPRVTSELWTPTPPCRRSQAGKADQRVITALAGLQTAWIGLGVRSRQQRRP